MNYDSDSDSDSFHEFDLSRYKSEGLISKILDGVYLSGYTAACSPETLKAYNIKRIISLGNEIELAQYETFSEVEYHRICIDDSNDVDIKTHFTKAVEFIKKSDDPILIHCWAGISRSVTILAAYLISEKGMNNYEAIDFIRQRRKCICPNIGFQTQLIAFSEEFK